MQTSFFNLNTCSGVVINVTHQLSNPGKETRYPLQKKGFLGPRAGRDGYGEKKIEPHTVQPVASRSTDYAIGLWGRDQDMETNMKGLRQKPMTY